MTDYAEKTFRSKDGLDLYYRDYAGPAEARHTLLCLPGLTRNSRDFEDLAAHLSQKHRVLCIDFRGRGKSAYAPNPMTYQPPTYVQDVNELLKAEQVTEAVFIGTSLGGLVSMLAANVVRHRVKAVVLNDVGPDIDTDGLDRIKTYLGKITVLDSWDDAVTGIKFLNGHVYPDWTDDQWLSMARKLCVEDAEGKIRPDYDPNIAIPFDNVAPVATRDLWPFFTALKGLPVLAIRGATSDILSDDTFQKMKVVCPHLRQAIVPRVGHAPYLMEPEALTAIEALLDELPADRGSLKGLMRRLGSLYYLMRAISKTRQ